MGGEGRDKEEERSAGLSRSVGCIAEKSDGGSMGEASSIQRGAERANNAQNGQAVVRKG